VLVIVTIPVGVLGLALEHTLRTVFAKPTAAAVFLFVNGLILLAGERLRRRDEVRALATAGGGEPTPEGEHNVASRRLETLSYREGLIIGVFQSSALLAGISRSGVTMVGGLVRGLDHEDAARFSFLGATPVILAAGAYKLPELVGHNGDGIRGQVLAGSVFAVIAAYGAIRWLMNYMKTRTLTPFGVYCLIVGAVCAVGFGTGRSESRPPRPGPALRRLLRGWGGPRPGHRGHRRPARGDLGSMGACRNPSSTSEVEPAGPRIPEVGGCRVRAEGGDKSGRVETLQLATWTGHARGMRGPAGFCGARLRPWLSCGVPPDG
jgi:undecaprenyl-diphosphatase